MYKNDNQRQPSPWMVPLGVAVALLLALGLGWVALSRHSGGRFIGNAPAQKPGKRQAAATAPAPGPDKPGAWRKAGREIGRHPAAVVYYDFERGATDRSLSNRVLHPPPDTAALIMGCGNAAGREPGKNALEFSRPDDRLRASLSGMFTSLTLMAWIRVESLPNVHNSLAMAGSFEPGEIHWFVHTDGTINAGIRTGTGETGAWQTCRSQPVVNENIGKWICIATTIDSESGMVSHYLNGNPVGARRLALGSVKLQPGAFEIGNWAILPDDPRAEAIKKRNARDLVRSFHGRMDEFAVFSAVLNADEIRRLYENGRPAPPAVGK